MNYIKNLKKWYKNTVGEELHLEHPKTYNEKIQWSKIYDSTPLKTQLADKYLVREWVKEKIGEEYLIPLLGVYDNFDEIDFDKLPNQFVIKCNHGSAYNIVVKDKNELNKEEARQKINKWMNSDYTEYAWELHYKPIKRKIIIEKYISSDKSNIEVQIWYFNGRLEFISCVNTKDTAKRCRCILSKDWKPLDIQLSPQRYSKFENIPEKINKLDELINITEKLAKGFPHVRIDFIEYDNCLKFREMTFTTEAGECVWIPDYVNPWLGSLWKLPEKCYDFEKQEFYDNNYLNRMLRRFFWYLKRIYICFLMFR